MYEIVVAGITAALMTYELNVRRGYGAVEASSAVGILFVMASVILSRWDFLSQNIIETIPFVGMGASFAGMSSKKAIPSHLWIAVCGMVFSIIFLFSSPVFAGLGGGLGLTACISVVMTRGAMVTFNVLKINTFSFSDG